MADQLPHRQPKSSTARVDALRARREALGLRRTEVYVHPDDRHEIRALEARLAQKRAGMEPGKAGRPARKVAA